VGCSLADAVWRGARGGFVSTATPEFGLTSVADDVAILHSTLDSFRENKIPVSSARGRAAS
jgi:hypothetical protein